MANEENHPDEEPVRFTDKRKVDPETGEVRADGDALSQAEEILDAAAADSGPEGTEPEGAEPEQDADAELMADLRRLQAEFTNYRRRVERDKEAAREIGTNAALSALVPVLDDIDAARKAGDLTDGPFASIAGKLDSVLSGLGLERIDEAGVEFDPSIHDALLRQAVPDIPADHVGMILRNGFRRGDRVLRAAQVMVSTGE